MTEWRFEMLWRQQSTDGGWREHVLQRRVGSADQALREHRAACQGGWVRAFYRDAHVTELRKYPEGGGRYESVAGWVDVPVGVAA